MVCSWSGRAILLVRPGIRRMDYGVHAPAGQSRLSCNAGLGNSTSPEGVPRLRIWRIPPRYCQPSSAQCGCDGSVCIAANYILLQRKRPDHSPCEGDLSSFTESAAALSVVTCAVTAGTSALPISWWMATIPTRPAGFEKCSRPTLSRCHDTSFFMVVETTEQHGER